MLSLRARRSSLAGLTTSVVLPAQWLLLIFLGDLSITLLPVGDRNDALLLTEQRSGLGHLFYRGQGDGLTQLGIALGAASFQSWIPSLQVGAGRRINRLFEKTLGQTFPRGASLKPSLRDRRRAKAQQNQGLSMVEAGGIEPRPKIFRQSPHTLSPRFAARPIAHGSGPYRRTRSDHLGAARPNALIG